MRILFWSIIGLQLLFSLLIMVMIGIAKQDERWCYQMQSFDNSLIWYWFDVQSGHAVEIHDPMMHDDIALRIGTLDDYNDFVWGALRFSPQPNREFLYDITPMQSDVHWTSDGRYMAYLTYDGTLYLKNALGNTLQSRQIDPLGSNAYAIYAFTIDGRYLIYYDQQEIHLLSVPDLQPAPFSPINPELPTVIDWSPSGEILLTRNAQQLLLQSPQQSQLFPNHGQLFQYHVWSEDGQRIAITYRRSIDANRSDLAIYSIQGEMKVIATDQQIEHLTWNQDRLWFWRKAGEGWQLVEYDQTSDQTTIRVHDADQVEMFSPDRTKALFYRIQGEQADLWMWDGQRETKLDSHTYQQPSVNLVDWTYDSAFLLIRYFAQRPQSLKIISESLKMITITMDSVDATSLQQSGQLLYYRTINGQQYLYWLDLATQTEQRLMTVPDNLQLFHYDFYGSFYLWDRDQTTYFGGFWFETRQWFEYEIPDHWLSLEEANIYVLPLQRQILFVENNQHQLWLLSPERSILFPLTSPIDRVSWSPDHRYMALTGQMIRFLDITTDRLQTINAPSFSASYKPLRWARCPLTDYPR
ncbi:MAG: hypothetical protein MUF87_19075 [Anaerolineae bacterium]|jgi:WD40 repeat protein|nr:hypothetical protein [Anaerolineae bacterium]